jgi:carboxyl-terminal processing protease
MRRLFVISAGLVVAVAAIGMLALTSPSVAGRMWPYLPASVKVRPALYLGHAIQLIRANALASGSVDWTATLARASGEAAGATTAADTYPALRVVLDALGDGQSTLIPAPSPPSPAGPAAPSGAYGLQVLYPGAVVATVFPQSVAEAAGIGPGDVVELVDGQPPKVSPTARARGHLIDIPSPNVTLRIRRAGDTDARDVALTVGPYQPIPAITRRIGGDVGYVELPGTTQGPDFAGRIQEAIVGTETPDLCGWIVDLRVNGGGNVTTILAGVGPILGSESPGAFVDADGRRAPWAVNAPSSGRQLQRPKLPVAVLTSRLTANAGEAIAVAFHGRPDTRAFGEATWGLPVGTTRYPLPDGAILELTTGRAADRTGHVYDGPVYPDELVNQDWSRFLQPDDPTIVAAAAWIRAKGCGK